MLTTLLLLGGACGPAPVVVESCATATPLFAIDDVLAKADHPCTPWLEAVRGRVARSEHASAVVWRHETEAGAGVLVSALHALNDDWSWPPGAAAPETLLDPADQPALPRIRLVASDGAGLAEQRIAMHLIYIPAVPAAENSATQENLLPGNDFFFAAIDGEPAPSGDAPDPDDTLTGVPPALYDPAGLSAMEPADCAAFAGDLVLLVGYPAAAPFYGTASASVGRVLSDTEADTAIAALAAAGDVEGEIPYEAAAEMIITGYARGGMSGGGVFDVDGCLVGVIVRASDERDGRQYVRAVRMTFAASELLDAVAAAPDDLAEQVRPWIELE